jgi:hypothetical protein
MVNIYKSMADGVMNEVHPYVNMFHSGVGLRVVRARDSSLVVAVEWGWVFLWEPQFFEQGA